MGSVSFPFQSLPLKVVSAPLLTMEWKATNGKDIRVTDIYSTPERYKLMLFYPFNWDPACLSLVAELKKQAEQFSSFDCSLFACSSDPAAAHLQWIQEELGGSLPFPLVGDPAGSLASKFSMFDFEERTCLRGFALTDSCGQLLETVVSALGAEELVKLAFSIAMRIPRSKVILEECGLNPEGKVSKYALPQVASTKEGENLFSVGKARHLMHQVLKKTTEDTSSEKDNCDKSVAFNKYMDRKEARLARGFF